MSHFYINEKETDWKLDRSRENNSFPHTFIGVISIDTFSFNQKAEALR